MQKPSCESCLSLRVHNIGQVNMSEMLQTEGREQADLLGQERAPLQPQVERPVRVE